MFGNEFLKRRLPLTRANRTSGGFGSCGGQSVNVVDGSSGNFSGNNFDCVCETFDLVGVRVRWCEGWCECVVVTLDLGTFDFARDLGQRDERVRIWRSQ